MRKVLAVVLMMSAGMAGRVWGDSIDDAEAQKRGVPVAVILLERQLEQEKRKTADLQKQVNDAEGKIETMKAGKATGAEVKAKGPTEDPELPKLVEGKRESSPEYDDLVRRYMSGDWKGLADDIGKRRAEIAKLPAGNASDIAYIKAAVAECKPAWWAKTKTGKAQSIDVAAFNRKLVVSWTPMPLGQSESNARVKGQNVAVEAGWSPDEMDEAGPLNSRGLVDLPFGKFTEDDMTDSTAWLAVALHIPSIELGAAKLAKLGATGKTDLDAVENMVGVAASMYYGTPAARRFTQLRCEQSYMISEVFYSPALTGRQLFAAFLTAEYVAHPDKYPSLKLKFGTLPNELPPRQSPEQHMMGLIDRSFKSNGLTLAEDCALREAIWKFVMSQSDWSSSEITLPNGLVVDADKADDGDLRKDRWEWIQKTVTANEKKAGN